MEIVLGIDNFIFISILVAKVLRERQDVARRLGLGLALLMRLALLFAIAWIMRLTAPLFTVLGNEFSGRVLILIVGGLFLIGKATFEIHDKLEVEHPKSADEKKIKASFGGVLVQIMLDRPPLPRPEARERQHPGGPGARPAVAQARGAPAG